MEELVLKLNALPNSYFGFVMGIVAYCKQNPNRVRKVLDFINSTDGVTPSEVVRFVMEQPDFQEYTVRREDRVAEPVG